MSRNKFAIVTGANSGLGKVAALELAKTGMQVTLVCRNPEKGKSVLREIKSVSGNQRVELLLCDLSSQRQVAELAKKIRSRYPRVDILLNNAGAINSRRTLTEDGIENTFATNHLAYFHLINLLLDRLKASPAARVINVASQAQQGGKIHWEDPGLAEKYSGMKAYMQSKLANIMFSNELVNRLKGTKISVNVVHPGVVRTGFGRNDGGFMEFVVKLFGPLLRSPEKGAETAVWLALAPEVEGITGQYFHDKHIISARPITHDREALKRLWQLSAEMVKPKGRAERKRILRSEVKKSRLKQKRGTKKK